MQRVWGRGETYTEENKGPVTAFGVSFCNKRENVDINRDVFCVVNRVGNSRVFANLHSHTTFANTNEFPTRFTTQKDVTTNIYVFSLVTDQYTKCCNRVFDLLKMCIMMPETC